MLDLCYLSTLDWVDHHYQSIFDGCCQVILNCYNWIIMDRICHHYYWLIFDGQYQSTLDIHYLCYWSILDCYYLYYWSKIDKIGQHLFFYQISFIAQNFPGHRSFCPRSHQIPHSLDYWLQYILVWMSRLQPLLLV